MLSAHLSHCLCVSEDNVSKTEGNTNSSAALSDGRRQCSVSLSGEFTVSNVSMFEIFSPRFQLPLIIRCEHGIKKRVIKDTLSQTYTLE